MITVRANSPVRKFVAWVSHVLQNDGAALGAILLFLGLGLLHALAVPPLSSVDERVHFSYALELRDGELPEIETPVRTELVDLSGREPRNTVWVANHPPLFYVLEAFAIGDVDTKDDVPLAFLRGRLLSVALTAIGLWFAFLCLREICEPRSRIPVLVLALLVTTPHFAQVMSLIFNDTLAFLMTTSVLWCAMTIMSRGFSAWRYVALLICAAALVATRLTGAMAAGAAITAMAIACHRAGAGGQARKLALTSAAVLGVLVAILVSSGWFYLRNHQLYGDISGATALFEKFDREPKGSLWTVLGRRWVWRSFIDQLWGTYSGARVRPAGLVVAKSVALVAMIGFVFVAISTVRRLRTSSLARVRAALVSPRTLTLVMLIGFCGLVIASIFGFHSRGGYPHARYLFAMLWIVLMIPALGLVRLGRSIPGIALTLLTAVHLLILDSYVYQVHDLGEGKIKDLLLVTYEPLADVPTGVILVLLAMVAAGLTIVLGHLGSADPPEPLLRRATKSSQPAGDRDPANLRPASELRP